MKSKYSFELGKFIYDHYKNDLKLNMNRFLECLFQNDCLSKKGKRVYLIIEYYTQLNAKDIDGREIPFDFDSLGSFLNDEKKRVSLLKELKEWLNERGEIKCVILKA